MQSKTSFFNKTLFRKNLTRFAPLWGGYLLVLLMVQVLVLLRARGYDNAYSYVDNLINTASLISMGYAFLVTQVLFGDLYNTRLCYGLHAMPVRREGLYLANIASGLLFNLIPTAIAAVVAAPMLAKSYVDGAAMLPLYWWVIMNLSYLFFFGAGACCAMLAGNRLGQAALYCIVNVGAVLLYLLVDQVYAPMLYGVLTIVDPYLIFSPAVMMGDSSLCLFADVSTWMVREGQEWVDAGEVILGDGWGYLLAVAAVGAVLLIAGVLLYRRRRLEAAGDFLAVKGLEPVVLVAISLSAGTIAAYVGNAYLTKEYIRIPFLFVGTVVGWFAGKMFLKRTTRVFRPRNWVGIGALCAVLLLSLGLTKLDVFGIASRVPELADIDYITLDGKLVAEEDEQTVLQLHAQALEDRLTADMFSEDESYLADVLSEGSVNNYGYFYNNELDSGEWTETVRITYTLNNGTTIDRRYAMLSSSEAGQLLRRLTSTISYIFNDDFDEDQAYQIMTLEDLLTHTEEPKSIKASALYSSHDAYVAQELLTKENLDMLLTAYAQDIQDGNASEFAEHATVTLSSGKEVSGYVYVTIDIKDDEDIGDTRYLYLYRSSVIRTLYFYVYPDCTNTIAALEELGIPWDTFVQQFEEWYAKVDED